MQVKVKEYIFFAMTPYDGKCQIYHSHSFIFYVCEDETDAKESNRHTHRHTHTETDKAIAIGEIVQINLIIGVFRCNNFNSNLKAALSVILRMSYQDYGNAIQANPLLWTGRRELSLSKRVLMEHCKVH